MYFQCFQQTENKEASSKMWRWEGGVNFFDPQNWLVRRPVMIFISSDTRTLGEHFRYPLWWYTTNRKFFTSIQSSETPQKSHFFILFHRFQALIMVLLSSTRFWKWATAHVYRNKNRSTHRMTTPFDSADSHGPKEVF